MLAAFAVGGGALDVDEQHDFTSEGAVACAGVALACAGVIFVDPWQHAPPCVFVFADAGRGSISPFPSLGLQQGGLAVAVLGLQHDFFGSPTFVLVASTAALRDGALYFGEDGAVRVLPRLRLGFL